MPKVIDIKKNFVPRNPKFQERVRESFDGQGVMKLINAELIRIGPGECDIRVRYSQQLGQQHGFFHGGILATIADSACGYAAFSLMPADASVLTVEFKTNFLAPADGEELVAQGRVIKPGRTITVSQADILILKEGEQHLCATMTATNMTMFNKVEE